jgi:Mature-T-Cell Proliferation I type
VQKCLQENQYQQHECQDVIDKLHKCCETYDLFGRSPNCAGLPTRKKQNEQAQANEGQDANSQ